MLFSANYSTLALQYPTDGNVEASSVSFKNNYLYITINSEISGFLLKVCHVCLTVLTDLTVPNCIFSIDN